MTISRSIRKPGNYTENDISQAVTSLPANAQTVALLAQMTSSGIGVADKPVSILSESDLILYGGTGSIAHLSGKALIDANPLVDLDLVPLDDAAGTDSTGTITMTGVDSTNAGSIVCWVGNERVEASVAVGDGSNEVADTLNDAIVASQHMMPITSTVSGAVITVVARNYGTLGNEIPVSYKKDAVLTDTTATVVQPTGGATDPSISDALTGIYPGKYNLTMNTLNNDTALGLLKTHLDAVAAPTEGRPGVGVYGYTGVQATVETQAGTTLNAERLSVGFLPYDATSERGHSLSYEVGAAYCSKLAEEEDPARPLNTLVLTGIAPPALSERLSRTQQESCLENGVTPLEVQPGEEVGIVRAISTYITSDTGYPDVSMLDITTIRTLDYTRFAIEVRLSSVFPRSKLSEKTPDRVRTQILDVLYDLEEQEILEKVAENADKVLVIRDAIDKNRVNCSIPADVVNGLHVIANTIRLYL
jgi:phage tail sheath gpL-like